MKNLVGYKWLSKKYNVSPVQSFEFKSISDQAGKNRSDTLSWHITFALKHEGIHLEFLNRLFKVIEETELVDWITSEPVWRQLSCPVRGNYPGRFLLKNGLLF